MGRPQPHPTSNAVAAGWIAPRLGGPFGAVCRTIPTGFEAYARILHPADPGGGAPLRWADLAEANGRTMHALAQYQRIAAPAPGRPAPTLRHDVQPPNTGDLDPGALRALCEILARHTPEASRCWFAVWEGWAGMTGGAPRTTAAGPRQLAPDPMAPSRFETPNRAYHLFDGLIDDALRLGSWVTPEWLLPCSPNLFWPDDRTWCVASEIDFDSTLVGGPRFLIDDVLRSDLEAWPVGPLDSLAWDADVVNEP